MYDGLADFAVQTLNAVSDDGLVLLSGGNSPRLFLPRIFAAVPASNLTWSVSDERCVPPAHDASNYGMIRGLECAPIDQLRPLYTPEKHARNPIWTDYTCYPMAILGFASDGHTCSIFADSEVAKMATDLNADRLYFENITKEGEAFKRMTFGFSMLSKALKGLLKLNN